MVFKSSSFTCKLKCVTAALSQRKLGSENSNINFLFCQCLAEALTSAPTPAASHKPSGQRKASHPALGHSGIQSSFPLRKLPCVISPSPAPRPSSAHPRPLVLILAKTDRGEDLYSVWERLTIRLWMKKMSEMCKKEPSYVLMHNIV